MAQPSLLNRLLGRSRRREYWLSMLGLAVALAALTGMLHGSWAAPAIVLPFWIWVALRRVHDFDAPSWLAWLVPGLELAMSIFDPISTARTDLAVILASVIMVLATPIFIVVIGLIPGTKGPNRFGPDPGAAGFDAAAFD